MSKISKNIMIVFVVVFSIVLIIVFAFGYWSGFYPLEHNAVIRNASRYVSEVHGLTPTDVRVTTLHLWFPVTVEVETEEHDAWLQLVTIRRESWSRLLYIEPLTISSKVMLACKASRSFV